MRTTPPLTILAVALGFAAPAFAQAGATQSPPSPNSGQSAPTPSNSLPAGGLTGNPNAPGGASPTMGAQTGVTGTPAPAAPTGSTSADPSSAFKQTEPQPSPSTGTTR